MPRLSLILKAELSLKNCIMLAASKPGHQVEGGRGREGRSSYRVSTEESTWQGNLIGPIKACKLYYVITKESWPGQLSLTSFAVLVIVPGETAGTTVNCVQLEVVFLRLFQITFFVLVLFYCYYFT